MKNKFTKTILEWLPTVLIIAGVFTVKSQAYDLIQVSGRSMQPTLENNQLYYVDKLDKTRERGEIIIFKAKDNNPQAKNESDIYVKRVIGLPGDTIELKDGKLYVNNREVNQSFLDGEKDGLDSASEKSSGTQYPLSADWKLEDLSTIVGPSNWNSWSQNKTVVPEGTLFVLGDHRSNSSDSRSFGFVKEDSVEGSLNEFLFLDNNPYVGKEMIDNFFVDGGN